MVRILLVEPNMLLSNAIAEALREKDYAVVQTKDSAEALSALDRSSFQMIIAESCGNGIEMTAELRNVGNTVPVIVMTENSGRSEMRKIFRSGADGYIISPPDLEELQMRVKVLLWRCNVVSEASLRFGSCVLHSQSYTLETAGSEIELRRMEFLLLEKLMSYPGKIFSRPQLMDDLWGYESESDPRTIDTHIRRLRKKLHDVDDIKIQTVRGLGYRLVVPRRIRRAENSVSE